MDGRKSLLATFLSGSLLFLVLSPLAVNAQEVVRSVFTTDVVDREPVDDLDSLSTDVEIVFYFTELKDMEGMTVTHKWMYGGEAMAEVPFDVGGPRWRVYSSKNLQSGWTGEWSVAVQDTAGMTIHEDSFVYTKGSGEREMESPAMPDTSARMGTGEMTSPVSGSVARALFTTAIEEREPADEVDTLSTAVDKVYFFTEIHGMSGATVTHRWMHDGEVKAEVPFHISGSKWRVYSSKNLLSDWTGDWTVQVVDDAGEIIQESNFTYVPQ